MKKSILLVLAVLFTSFIFSQSFEMKSVIVVPDPVQDLRAEISVDRGEGGVYNTGEQIRVNISVNKSAYVVIWDIEPDGNTHIIFPNAYDQNNYIEGNRFISLPRSGYKYIVEGKTGMETLQIIASTTQFVYYNDWKGQFMSEQYPLVTSNASRDLKQYISKMVVVPDSQPSWTTAMTYFFVSTKPQYGILEINSSPSGASIFLDGNWLGNLTPCTMNLWEGNHYVEIRKPGYLPYITTVTVSPYAKAAVNAILQPEITYGKLSVEVSPSDSAIYVDGRMTGTGKVYLENILPGKHTILCSRHGYYSVQETIDIFNGELKEAKYVLLKSTGTLNLTVSPLNATVKIDGIQYGIPKGKLVVELSAGAHNISVQARGYEGVVTSANINAGENADLQIALNPKKAKLVINSKPEGASVYINSEFKGVSPLSLELDAGAYTIAIQKEGYYEFSVNTKLEPGAMETISASLSPEMGKIVIKAPFTLTAYIDGILAGTVNAGFQKTIELIPGIHEIVLLSPKKKAYITLIDLGATRTLEINPVFTEITE